MAKRGAFTLVELMVVIIIIAVLAFLVSFNLYKVRQKAKLAEVTTQLTDISKSVNEYADDNNFQYPPDVDRGVPPGLEKYLIGGAWPTSVWPHGVFDWDNWTHPITGQQIYQVTYRLCNTAAPDYNSSQCSDPVLFPNFNSNSGIYYCIYGPCIPHNDNPGYLAPAYCINCNPKKVNY